VVEIALLRSLPLFRWLPAPSLEASARALVPVELAVGDVLIQEGDANLDRFYALASGEVDVLRHDTHVATLGRGQGVGEMALLRSIPRTATVVARTPVLAYALERESFLVAVTGHAATATAADAVVDERLADLAAKGLAAE
jgi:CRP-like cAMP-binding protein